MFDLLKNLVELWENSPDVFIFTTLIYLACGVGGVCWVICLCKTLREKSALNQAKQDWGSICAGNSGGDIYADIRKRAEEKLPAATLVKSRVIDICEWYQKNSQDETPQLQDLHRNSFSKMENAGPAFILRALTSVLLIVGICGTLWCVHTCLAGGNQVLNNLSLLGNALNPSKWAISFTIVLLILRGIYRLRVSRLLWHLDNFTIKRIIPDLQQRGDISQTLDQLINSLNEVKKQMKSFSSSVSAFQNTAESLGAVTEAIESSNADFKDQIQNVQDEYGRLEATINSAQDVWDKLGETILQTAEQGRTTSNKATALLNKQQENLQARERETAALLALTKKAQDLQTTTSGVADMVTSLAGLEQDIPRLQQQMSTLQTALTEENADTEQALSRMQEEQKQLTAAGNTLQQGMEQLNTLLLGVQGSTRRMEQKEEEHAAQLAAYEGQMKQYDVTMGNYGVAMIGYGTKMSEYAAAMEQYAATMQDNATKITAYENTMSGYDAKMGEYAASLGQYAATMQDNANKITAYENTMGGYAVTMSSYDTKMGEYAAAMEQYAATMQDNDNKITTYENTMGEYAVTMSDYDTKMGEYAATWATYAATMHSYENLMKVTQQTVHITQSTSPGPTVPKAEEKPNSEPAKITRPTFLDSLLRRNAR